MTTSGQIKSRFRKDGSLPSYRPSLTSNHIYMNRSPHTTAEPLQSEELVTALWKFHHPASFPVLSLVCARHNGCDST